MWRASCALLSTVNGLDKGKVNNHEYRQQQVTIQQSVGQVKASTDPQSLALRRLVSQVATVVRARRSEGLTGVHRAPESATACLLKVATNEFGYAKTVKHKQIPLIADRMIEPDPSIIPIQMLEHLPRPESIYYSSEANVVNVAGKSRELAWELEARFSFVGGSEAEYIKYLGSAKAIPLWEWSLASAVKAFSGISTVVKKDNYTQRKLMMQCVSNYWFDDVKKRSNLGMGGGSALARAHFGKNDSAIASLDEDSAFTFIETPKWMWYWCAAPPLEARKVKHLLPDSVWGALSSPSELVAPLYRRLAMGSSHSVHIIMQINLHTIGKALLSFRWPTTTADRDTDDFEKPSAVTPALFVAPQDALEESLGVTLDPDTINADAEIIDDENSHAASNNISSLGVSGWSVDSWCTAVNQARRSGERIMVVMHLFGGEPWDYDIGSYLRGMAASIGMFLLFLSADLAYDSGWDLANPQTFARLYELVRGGLVDIIFGGPPCSTVSRVRHRLIPNGPRPLRWRSEPWGRKDLRHHELARVEEANILWLFFFSLVDALLEAGGKFGMEHPEDPRQSPFPSIFILPELLELEAKGNATRARFDQGAFGAKTVKPTETTGNLLGLSEIDGVRVPGDFKRDSYTLNCGRRPQGGYHTTAMAKYPAALNRFFAECIFRTLCFFVESLSGPTGPLLDREQVKRRLTSWSCEAKGDRPSIAVLNESTVRGIQHRLDKNAMALYVHVDDVVTLGCSINATNALLSHVLQALTAIGFVISQTDRAEDLKKTLGYEVNRASGCLQFPVEKSALLQGALKEQTNLVKVNVDTLATLVGIWLYGALLERSLMSIPHNVFQFIHVNRGKVTRWWPSVKDEVVAMSRTVALMRSPFHTRFHNVVFGTDAQGMGEGDMGGYGITATIATPDEITDILKVGELPGLTVRRANQFEGLLEAQSLRPTVPVTRVNHALFKTDRWKVLERGRWKHGDHITLGECRAVLKLLRRAALTPEMHESMVISVQDNVATSCAFKKGRSSSFPILRILRQRAAITLACSIRVFLPWCESKLQPADAASRQQ